MEASTSQWDWDDSLDATDRKILEYLNLNSRISYSELAPLVGLSRPGVTERVSSLQRRGVIERFTVVIPSDYIRKPLPAFFDIMFEPSKVKSAAEEIARHPDIVTVYQMSARNSLHVHGFFASINDVGEFVEGYLVDIEGMQEVKTDFLLRRFKSDRV